MPFLFVLICPNISIYLPNHKQGSIDMPGIQEYMSGRSQAQNKHWLMVLIFLLPKVIILTYRIIRHAIQYGWIFPALGIAIAGVIHGNFPHLHVAWVVIIYIALIGAGIPLMIWKLNRNKQSEYELHIFINPDIPEDLYEED